MVLALAADSTTTRLCFATSLGYSSLAVGAEGAPTGWAARRLQDARSEGPGYRSGSGIQHRPYLPGQVLQLEHDQRAGHVAGTLPQRTRKLVDVAWIATQRLPNTELTLGQFRQRPCHPALW